MAENYDEIINRNAMLEMGEAAETVFEAENDAKKIEWDAKRILSKNIYLIQSDAVKNYLISSRNYKENLE